MDKRVKLTRLVLEHIERADDAVKNFRENGTPCTPPGRTPSRPWSRCSPPSYGPERITQALRKAGLELQFDPPAVGVNPYLFNRAKRPPIYERWQRWRKVEPRPGKGLATTTSLRAHTCSWGAGPKVGVIWRIGPTKESKEIKLRVERPEAPVE